MEYFEIKNGINLFLLSFPRLLVLPLTPQKTQAACVCVCVCDVYCADRSEGQTLKGGAQGCSSKHSGVLGIWGRVILSKECQTPSFFCTLYPFPSEPQHQEVVIAVNWGGSFPAHPSCSCHFSTPPPPPPSPPTAQCQVTTYLFWFPSFLNFQHLLESAPSGVPLTFS